MLSAKVREKSWRRCIAELARPTSDNLSWNVNASALIGLLKAYKVEILVEVDEPPDESPHNIEAYRQALLMALRAFGQRLLDGEALNIEKRRLEALESLEGHICAMAATVEAGRFVVPAETPSTWCAPGLIVKAEITRRDRAFHRFAVAWPEPQGLVHLLQELEVLCRTYTQTYGAYPFWRQAGFALIQRISSTWQEPPTTKDLLLAVLEDVRATISIRATSVRERAQGLA